MHPSLEWSILELGWLPHLKTPQKCIAWVILCSSIDPNLSFLLCSLKTEQINQQTTGNEMTHLVLWVPACCYEQP